MSLFDRLLKVRKGDFGIVKEYLKLCIQIGSVKNFYRVFVKNTKYFGQMLDYWLIAVYYEFEVRRNIFKARDLFLKGIASNSKELVFLVEYMEFEARMFKLIEERQHYLTRQTKDVETAEDRKGVQDEDKMSEESKSDVEEIIDFDEEGDNNNNGFDTHGHVSTMEEIAIDKVNIFDNILRKMMALLNSQENANEDEKELIERALEIFGETVNSRSEIFDELEQYYMNKYSKALYSNEALNYFYSSHVSNLPTEFNNISVDDAINILSRVFRSNAESINPKNLKMFIGSLNLAGLDLEIFTKNVAVFGAIIDLYAKTDRSLVPSNLISFLHSQKANINCFRLLLNLEHDASKALALCKEIMNKLSTSVKIAKTGSETILHKQQILDVYLKRVAEDKRSIAEMTHAKVDEIIKLANLKKELLKTVADHLISWMGNNLLEASMRSYIAKKFISLKNYCPVHMVTYLINNKLIDAKEPLLEEFLRYNKDYIELWKIYLLHLRSLTKVSKLEKAYHNGLTSLNDNDKTEWINFYKGIS